MRRLDWPDEPGWWWVKDADGTVVPEHFYLGNDAKTTYADDMRLNNPNYGDLEFIGPMKKPGFPMRKEFIGYIYLSVKDTRIWCRPNPPSYTLGINVDEEDVALTCLAGNRFRITLEEIP